MDFRYPRAFQRLLPLALTAGILLFGLTGSGCQTAYYETMEKLGYHKRDLMVSDVKKARDAQQDAKEQFKSGLDRFTKTLNVQGGDLQDKYDVLNDEYQQSEKRAQAVRTRIASVEDVSEALFKEWNAEHSFFEPHRRRGGAPASDLPSSAIVRTIVGVLRSPGCSTEHPPLGPHSRDAHLVFRK